MDFQILNNYSLPEFKRIIQSGETYLFRESETSKPFHEIIFLPFIIRPLEMIC